MDELSREDKLRVLRYAYRQEDYSGLCDRIAKSAVETEDISDEEHRSFRYKYFICKILIPEFCQIKPVNIDPDDAYCNYWFDYPTRENFPKRQAALEQLIEIIKSKP
jgi:hypothetical protein